MVHIEVTADVSSWREWALGHDIHPDILGLLGLRPGLLHELSRDHAAWPSPRTWQMASTLHGLGLDVAAAVGEGAAAELSAFIELKETLPALDPILAGQGSHIAWPDEMSLRWAIVVGLAFQVRGASQVGEAFSWLRSSAGAEWQSLFLQDCVSRFRAQGRLGELAVLMTQQPDLAEFVDQVVELVA
jgi:hypothetical protein